MYKSINVNIYMVKLEPIISTPDQLRVNVTRLHELEG